MTHAQVTALSYGLLAFITLWGIILIPQLITQYARHGRVRVRGLAISGGVTLYGCLALAVVLLPLPGPNTPRLTQTVQLQPFQWVADIHTELLKHGLSSAHALSTLTFQQVAMNVLLFVPLGLIARLLWKRGLIGTLLIGFTISLAIEITQLTANFGTAPYAYRIFDVDDLMTNTTGAVLGWIVAALLLALTAKNKTASTVDVQPVRSERIHLTEAR